MEEAASREETMMQDNHSNNEMDLDQSDEENVEEKAPEGGWGWVVAFGLAIVLIVSLGPMACFGLIFGNFLEDLGEGTSGVTLVNSVYMAVYSFSGLFTNYALKSYSCRRVALVGSLLFFLGNTLTSFATTMWHMIITFGILPGVGLGLMLPASFHCFNDYFVRRRVLVMGIAQTTLSAGVMLYPIIVEQLMEKHSFRVAQGVVAGMTLGGTLGALSFRPADKKSIRFRDLVSSKVFKMMKGKLISRKLSCGEKIGSADSVINVPSLTVEDVSKPGEENQPTDINDKHSEESQSLMGTPDTGYINRNNNSEVSTNNESTERRNGLTADWKPKDQTCPLMMDNEQKRSRSRTSSLAADATLENGISNGRRSPLADRLSIISTGSTCIAVVVPDNPKSHAMHLQDGRRNCWYAIVDFLDLTLLKDPVYSNLALGVSFVYFSDFTFVTLFPLFMFSLGYSMSETALCIAVGAACDLGGRIAFSLLGAFTSIRSRTIFLVGAICMVFGRTVMIYAHNYLVLTISNGFHGFFRAWIHANFALVFAEYCPKERFPSAYGLFMAVSGIIGISTGPLVGVIRDVTGSYPICIHSLNIQMLLCIVPWIAELIYVRFFRKTEKEIITL